MIKRRGTRQIRVGKVRIGGSAPVSIQSMTNTTTSDVKRTVSQIKALEAAGCEIVRVAVKTFEDAAAIKAIQKKICIPLVADIHFDYRLALKSIESGADKVRINPGNMRDAGEVVRVIRAAKGAGIPIRIGVNSGSVSKGPGARVKGQGLVKAALKHIKLFEKNGFHDIIISLKSSDVAETVDAYRRMAKLCDYPLHLGVTATGPHSSGIVKSAIGVGALLLDGIGDTVRISLTADPIEEIAAAKRILQSSGRRVFGPDIISCPTCGRCQVDLIRIVSELEQRLNDAVRCTQYAVRKNPLTIAVMGCEVNGPGEAREADIGIAFGKESGLLFKNGKILRKINVKDAAKELIREFVNSV